MDSISLRRRIIELIRRGFHAAGIEVSRHVAHRKVVPDAASIHAALAQLRDSVDAKPSGGADELDFLLFCAGRLESSHAQLLQDLFVLYVFQEKRGGYFVEFGGADGVVLSNSLLLEKRFGWNGIVAEPARCWHEALQANRRCHVARECVWHTTGETLDFSETIGAPELSTLAMKVEADSHALARQREERYTVTTISLEDLLRRFDAPRAIDYLSIDTEGSELEILSSFNFGRYDIGCITVEHNYTDKREAIRSLLEGHGYVRRFESLSRFDDWYVKPHLTLP